MGRHVMENTPFVSARLRAGLTQAQVSEISGLSHPTVVKIEKRPWETSWASLKKYISVLPDDEHRASLAKWAADVKRRKAERMNELAEREFVSAIEGS